MEQAASIAQAHQATPDWIDRFKARLMRVHPGVDPDASVDLGLQLWAASELPAEEIADIVARLLPDEE